MIWSSEHDRQLPRQCEKFTGWGGEERRKDPISDGLDELSWVPIGFAGATPENFDTLLQLNPSFEVFPQSSCLLWFQPKAPFIVFFVL